MSSKETDRRAQTQSCDHQLCLLAWHCNEGESFFNCIISDLNTQLWTTKQCVQWKHCHLLPQKMQDSAFSWEFNADVLGLSRSYLSKLPEMWNYSNKFIKHSDILWNDRRPVILKKKKTGEDYQKGVLILYDNAEPHSVAHTGEILQELKFWSSWPSSMQFRQHIQISIYMDLWMVLSEVIDLKMMWRKQCTTGLALSPNSFFLYVIIKLLDCWIECVQKHGHYTWYLSNLIY